MIKAPIRPTLAALALIAALWCAPDAGASGMRAADVWGVARPAPSVGGIVATPLCEGFNLGNSLDARGVAPGRPLWLSRDPLGEAGGLNLYGFVSNDPVNRWDYLGLSDELVISSTGGAYWVASRKGWFGKEIWRFPIGKRDGANNIRLSSSAGFFDDGGGLVTERDLRRMIEAQNLVYEPYVDDDYETIEDYHPDVQKLMNGYLSRVPRADQKRNGFGNAGELFSHARALQEADAMFGGGIFDDGQRRGLERANAFGSDVVEGFRDARDFAAREGAITVASGGALTFLRFAGNPKTLGLALNEDLFNLRLKARTYKDGGWQDAGLTTVDFGRASVDRSAFRESFEQAARNAEDILFDVTSFDEAIFEANRGKGFIKDNMTGAELDFILGQADLLEKTTFVRGGNEVVWDGLRFVLP